MGDETKNDSEKEGGKLDKILSHLDSFKARMDAADDERKADKARLDAACAKLDAAEDEKKKADAAKKDADEKEEKEKADKAKADAAEEEEKAKKDAAEKEEKAKADAARATDSNADVRRMIADMEKRLPANMTSADITLFTGAQRRAEKVVQAFGDSAGADRWANGETYDAYRRRLLGTVKSHSAQWKDVDLTAFGDKALDTVEAQIYADAYQTAISPASVPVGTLREHISMDDTGRKIKTYTGDPGACWDMFKAQPRLVAGLTVKFPH
jgi:flagellar biosynthesis GTPase FlhF